MKARTAFLIVILLGVTPSARSSEILITSPDHAQTFAYGEMIWHQLFVDPGTNALSARVTFSNLPYAGSPESQVDEPFNFRFPRTRAEVTSKNVLAWDRKGNEIVVASFCGNPTNGWVQLTAGAKVYLLRESGRVTAVLTATRSPRAGMRWIQMDNNWSLQNLLRVLCAGQS